MSFRELTMIDVREVLRHWTAGQSVRQMAREGVVGRPIPGGAVPKGASVVRDRQQCQERVDVPGIDDFLISGYAVP